MLNRTGINPKAIPDGIPSDVEHRMSALDRLKHKFIDWAGAEGYHPLSPYDYDGNHQIAAIQELFKREFPRDTNSKSIQHDARVALMGSAAVLYEVLNNYYYTVVDRRAIGVADTQRSYEKFENAVLTVVELGIGNGQKPRFTPIFSPEAHAELVAHAKIIEGYLSSPMKDGTTLAHDIEVPSYLFSVLTETLQIELDLRGSPKLQSHLIADIQGFRVLGEHEFEIEILVDRYGLDATNEARYLGSTYETHRLTASLKDNGRLTTEYKGQSRGQAESKREAA